VYPISVALTILVAIVSSYPLRRLANISPASVFRGKREPARFSIVAAVVATNHAERAAGGGRIVVKQYGPLRALDDVTFGVAPGEWVALMGPSGSGKTTLINILGGLDTLTSGHVIVDDVDLSKRTENQLVRYRSEKVASSSSNFTSSHISPLWKRHARAILP